LNKENLNDLLYLEPDTLDVTTSTVARNIGIFEDIFGPNVPLSIQLSFTDMKFTFGQSDDTNLLIDYRL
jgi:hypothetical protein